MKMLVFKTGMEGHGGVAPTVIRSMQVPGKITGAELRAEIAATVVSIS